MSQRAVARGMGFSQGFVSDVINNKKSPSLDFCIAVAHALDLPPNLVATKAGLLPPASPDDDPTVAEILETVRALDPDQRRTILEFAQFLLRSK